MYVAFTRAVRTLSSMQCRKQCYICFLITTHHCIYASNKHLLDTGLMSTLSGIITMIVVSASNRLLKSSYLKVVSPRRVDKLHEVLGGASIGVTEGASHATIFVFSRTARELFLLVYFFKFKSQFQ